MLPPDKQEPVHILLEPRTLSLLLVVLPIVYSVMPAINLGACGKFGNAAEAKVLAEVKRLNLTSLWSLVRKPSGFGEI